MNDSDMTDAESAAKFHEQTFGIPAAASEPVFKSDSYPTPWSELETKHVEHFDWPQWRVNADREVEVRIPTSFATVEVTITRLDAKAMLADLEEATR